MKLLIVSVLFFLHSVPAAQAQGASGSHGGDTLVSEFIGTADRLSLELAKPSNQASCHRAPEVIAKIAATRVDSKPMVFLPDGTEHDAENFYLLSSPEPQPRINLSRSRFIEITDPKNYLVVILHEYYGLVPLDPSNPFPTPFIGVEDTNDTRISRRCIESLEANGLDLKSLVYHVPVITSMERQFAGGDGSFYFQCKNETDHFRISVNYSPAMRSKLGGNQDGYFIMNFLEVLVDHDFLTEKYTRLAARRMPDATPDDILKQFVHSYSIDSGIGTNTFVLNLYRYRLVLKTEDRSNWKMTLIPDTRTAPTLQADCSPTLLKGQSP